MSKYRITALRTSQVEWIVDSEKIDAADLKALLDPSHPDHDEVVSFVVGERPDDVQDEQDECITCYILEQDGKPDKIVWES